MGLSFSHCRASWSYRGFNEFRERLARAIGMDLRAMEGFDGDKPWPSAAKEPLIYLLNHSDCDGHLTPHQCKLVAPRLKAIIEAWPDGDYKLQHDKRMGRELVKGMKSAAARKQNLEFR